MSMVFQGSMNGFTPVFTVGAQIDEVLKIHGREGGQPAVRKLLGMVDLDESIARRYPHELSGGQKQRAFIAMALALEPKLLFADEPTTALDVITQANIINLLKRLRREMGISILLITHDLALLSEAADTIYIMYAGRIVELGPSEGRPGRAHAPLHPGPPGRDADPPEQGHQGHPGVHARHGAPRGDVQLQPQVPLRDGEVQDGEAGAEGREGRASCLLAILAPIRRR